jgi:hypothetical protein
MYIHDTRFVTTLYRDFGHRGVAGRANQAALARMHISATTGDGIDALRLTVCNADGPRLVIGYHCLRGATVLVGDPAFIAINHRELMPDAVHEQLTRLLFRFCKRHGVIDRHGRLAIVTPLRQGACA